MNSVSMTERLRPWFTVVLLVLFAVLTVLAVVFYRERLLVDSGYYLMRMINSGWPWVEHQRYILVLSQFLPWLGTMAELPVKEVLLLYSLNHILFPFAVFCIALFRYRQPMAGVVLLMLQTGGLTTGFFVPMFELYYAATLLVLFCLIAFVPGRVKNLPVLLVAAFLILTSHPAAIVLLTLVMVIHILKNRRGNQTFYLLMSGLVLVVAVLKLSGASSYESEKIAWMTESLLNGTFNLQWFMQRAVYMFQQYALILILMPITWVMLIMERKPVEVALYAGIFLIVFLLSALNTNTPDHSRYNEQVWFPVVVLTVLPWLISVEPRNFLRAGVVLTLAFMLFFGYRTLLIVKEGNRYAERRKTIEQLNEAAYRDGGQHFVVDEALVLPDGIPGFNWSLPIESMLLSAQNGPASTLTVCTTVDYFYEGIHRRLDGDSYLFRRFETEYYRNLNPAYFLLQPGLYYMLEPLPDGSGYRTYPAGETLEME